MSKIKAFVTGSWLKKDNFNRLTLSPLSNYLNFEKLDYISETFLEGLSILETLQKVSKRGIFVRSGKGSVDAAIYKTTIEHIYHIDKGIPDYLEKINRKNVDNIVDDIVNLAIVNNIDTIVFTGSFYHYFRDSKYKNMVVLKDKDDIRPYYNFKGSLAIRNFHTGDKILEKSSFTNLENAMDFGSGKVSYKDKTVKIDVNDIDLTIKNVLSILN